MASAKIVDEPAAAAAAAAASTTVASGHVPRSIKDQFYENLAGFYLQSVAWSVGFPIDCLLQCLDKSNIFSLIGIIQQE